MPLPSSSGASSGASSGPPDPPGPPAAGAPESVKERLFVPTRASMPLPGDGSVFGRGFLANLRATGAGGGCLMVPLLIGAAMILFGLAGIVGPYKEGLLAKGDQAFFYAMTAFGTIFFLILFRVFQTNLAAGRNARRFQGDPKAPWTWDFPWNTQWMKPDYTGLGAGMLLGRTVFLGLLALMTVVGWGAGPVAKIVLGVFDLLGVLILYDSVQKVVQWLRIRHPVVLWPTIPFFCGGTLEGRVAFSRSLPAQGPAKVTLRRVQEEWELVSTGKNSTNQRQLAPFVRWKETREFPLGEGGDMVDFEFQIPTSQPGTKLRDDEAVYWQIEVVVPVLGPDIEAIFLAPVYKRP